MRSNTNQWNHYQNDHLAAKSSCGVQTDMAVGFQYASSVSRLYGGRESPHQSRASLWVWVAPADTFHDQIDDREGGSTESAESLDSNRPKVDASALQCVVFVVFAWLSSVGGGPCNDAVCGRWLGAHVCTIVAPRPNANRRHNRVIYVLRHVLHV